MIIPALDAGSISIVVHRDSFACFVLDIRYDKKRLRDKKINRNVEKNNKKSNKLNVPSTLVDVASKIAEIRNTSYSEIAEITYNNACDFFDIKQ